MSLFVPRPRSRTSQSRPGAVPTGADRATGPAPPSARFRPSRPRALRATAPPGCALPATLRVRSELAQIAFDQLGIEQRFPGRFVDERGPLLGVVKIDHIDVIKLIAHQPQIDPQHLETVVFLETTNPIGPVAQRDDNVVAVVLDGQRILFFFSRLRFGGRSEALALRGRRLRTLPPWALRPSHWLPVPSPARC